MARAFLAGLVVLFFGTPAQAGLFGGGLGDYTKRPGFTWRSSTASNLTVYYEPGTRAERDLPGLQLRFARSVRAVETLLELPPYRKRIHVFVLESRERKQALMGDPGWGGAIPRRNVLFGVYNDRGNGCSTHEFCHVIAGNLWGVPERWLDEGLATYSDERWRDRLHREAAALLAQGRLLPLETLFRDFLKHPERVSHVQAGSVVRFLHETFGTGALRKIWKGGHTRIPKATGRSLADLERAWRAAITAAAAGNP